MQHLLSALLLLVTTATATASATGLGIGFGTETVRFSWTHNEDVAGFRIHVGTEPGNYTITVDCPGTDTREGVIDGLTLGVTHYASITAYNSYGAESEYSQEIAFVPQPKTEIKLVPELGGTEDPEAGTDPGTRIRFDAPEGYLFNLLYSDDLRNWTLLEAYLGNGSEISAWWPRLAPQEFFQLQITRP